jgi:hypothetical protein
MAKRTKKIILLDTSIFIEILRNNTTIINHCDKIGDSYIAFNPIVRAELYAGAGNKAGLLFIKRLLTRFNHYRIDNQASKKFEELITTYTLSHGIGIPDALIAATAIANGLELYTLNIQDFDFIKGLKLYQP